MNGTALKTMPGNLGENEPLSETHRMLAKIGREHHARRLNRVVNHPEVYRWVRGYATEPLDLSPTVANPANVLLMGEHGGVLFVAHQPGLYEAHTQVTPEGRGAWALAMVRAALFWMFTRTDAIEIMTKCPKGNLGARALARAVGGTKEFTARKGWVVDLDPVDADVFGLTLQAWARTADGLVQRGVWFHALLEAEFARHGKAEPPHEEDEDHNRAVGMAAEMMLGGQIGKALVFYGRAASLAGYGPIKLTSMNPLTIDIGTALLIVRDGAFWAPVVR